MSASRGVVVELGLEGHSTMIGFANCWGLVAENVQFDDQARGATFLVRSLQLYQ